MKDYYYDNNIESIKHFKNQSNENAVIVILYNSKKEPIELVTISHLELKEYTATREEFIEFKNSDVTILSLNRLVNKVIKSFNLGLTHYFHLYEPKIDMETPRIIMQKDNNAFKADAVKLKPVLSFCKKDQLITFDTYCRSIVNRGFIQY
jgi:hypothetical protein